MDLLQKQKEVFDVLGSAARGLVQWELKEGEGEASRKAEVGDGMQWWETGRARSPALRKNPPPRLKPSVFCRS